MKQRIEFIDLAKGICIFLVVMVHCGIFFNMPGLSAVRMPLYFVLSGLFFKDYGSLKNFVIKKINKILIPFLFFYTFSYLLFYIFDYIFPGLIVSDATGILDVFTQRQYFNGPIWFLLSLFWSNCIFCAISLNIKKEKLRCLIVLFFGIVGYILGKNEVFVPCVFDVSLTALPLFYLGYILKKSSILYPNKYDKYNLLFGTLLWLISFVIECRYGAQYIGWLSNSINGSLLVIIPLQVLSVMAILLFCKVIKTVPVVTYWGRYSIIILCTHHLYYRPLCLVLKNYVTTFDYHYVVAVLTMVLCTISIPICKKVIPYFCAQKDLIKVKI